MTRKRIPKIMMLSLAILVMLSPVKFAYADSLSSPEKIIQILGIMNTDKKTGNSPTDKVSRAEFAQMLVNMSQIKDNTSAKSTTSVFSDVTKKHWAAGYIKAVVNSGWMSGYLDGTFKPGKAITLQEAAGGILKLLGYSNFDYSLYISKGLNKNIAKGVKDELTRRDISNLLYNALIAKNKEGRIYAEVLGYSLNANGEVDYLSLVNSDLEGPVIADDDWKNEIPFSVSSSTVYKNESIGNINDIKDFDVLYYSETSKTIWAYDNKVTGMVKSINPDRLNPTSVNVGGKEYNLGTNEAAYQFSSYGNFKTGDMVTLLLGKDNTVAGVLSLDEYNITLTGVVINTGEHINDDDFTYANYVEFVTADGTVQQEDYNADEIYFAEGDIARVTYKEGKAAVSKYYTESRNFGNNTFNAEGTKLGDTPLASNVKILDYYEGKYIRVLPERLANVTLAGDAVYYYETNASGEITQLILNNVTGDIYDYGVISGLSFSGSSNGTISYLTGETEGSLNANLNLSFDLSSGPKGFLFEGNSLREVINLSGVKVVSAGSSTIQTPAGIYPMADNVCVYYLSNGKYISTTLDKVGDTSKYSLTAYYDKSIQIGGLVRVIVAESK